jgi:hypothetical protein
MRLDTESLHTLIHTANYRSTAFHAAVRSRHISVPRQETKQPTHLLSILSSCPILLDKTPGQTE